MTRNVRIRVLAAAATAAITAALVPVLTAGAAVPATPAVQSAAIALPSASPGDGAMLDRAAERGQGELVIENGTAHDAYVTLARGDDAVETATVPARATRTVDGVPDGEYLLFVETDTGTFRFEETFPFDTTDTSSTVWTVGLQPVEGGNASTVPVPPGAVPR